MGLRGRVATSLVSPSIGQRLCRYVWWPCHPAFTTQGMSPVAIYGPSAILIKHSTLDTTYQNCFTTGFSGHIARDFLVLLYTRHWRHMSEDQIVPIFSRSTLLRWMCGVLRRYSKRIVRLYRHCTPWSTGPDLRTFMKLFHPKRQLESMQWQVHNLPLLQRHIPSGDCWSSWHNCRCLTPPFHNHIYTDWFFLSPLVFQRAYATRS